MLILRNFLHELLFISLLMPSIGGGVVIAADTQNAEVSITKQDLANKFSASVTPFLEVPEPILFEYIAQLDAALKSAKIELINQQFVILVDRNPSVQAVFLYLGSTSEGWSLLGATPVSSGLPGKFEHFLTPIGVFEHSLDNLDFRAEGTKNELGFRGYGEKGMRIYDFGWIPAQRTWGKKGMGILRLQMHATDPELAEYLLGTRRSEGCIRIPATLNRFIDQYGVLDAQYDEAVAHGAHFWVLRKDRRITPFSGRYLAVIESNHETKPAWSKPLKRK